MQNDYDERDARRRSGSDYASRGASSREGAASSNAASSRRAASGQQSSRRTTQPQQRSSQRMPQQQGSASRASAGTRSTSARPASGASVRATGTRSAGTRNGSARQAAGTGTRGYGGDRGMGTRRAHDMNEVSGYSSSTHYDANTLKQYSRSNYSGRNGSSGANKDPRSRLKVLIAALVVLAVVGGAAWFYHTMPKQITVNGIEAQVAYNMTYQGLHDKGLLTETNGNLLAVDGSMLEEGGGAIYKIYSNGDLVTDYSSRVKKGDVVTESVGDNTTEEYTETDTTVPWTWDIDGGTDYNFYKGSLTLEVNAGSDGINRTFTGITSGKSVLSDTSTPMVPRLYKSVTYTPASGKLVCALTFDDGPSDYTEQVMDVLQQYGVTATFFELGSNIENYPTISKEVVDRGYQVASHGYIHGGDDTPYMNEMTAEELTNDLNKAYAAIENATGETADKIVVRPSGGNLNYDAIVNSNGMVKCFVGWDVDTEDWRRPGADTIVQTAMAEMFPGAIILMHDGGGDRTQTIEALQTLIPTLQSQGYEFVTVNQLIDLQMQQYQADGTAVSAAASSTTASTTASTTS